MPNFIGGDLFSVKKRGKRAVGVGAEELRVVGAGVAGPGAGAGGAGAEG